MGHLKGLVEGLLENRLTIMTKMIANIDISMGTCNNGNGKTDMDKGNNTTRIKKWTFK